MPFEKIVSLAAAAAAALVLAGAAGAQVPRGLERNDASVALQANVGQNAELSAQHWQSGMDALQAKNFSVAESVFADLLRQDRNNARANLMMGVALMGQDKWTDAKKYLEIAVKKIPKEPDPKSRLGVTYIKLGEMDAAKKQRDELAKLSKDCKGTCPNAKWIDDGIAMIDAAMPKS